MAKQEKKIRVLYCEGPHNGPLQLQERLQIEVWDNIEKEWSLISIVPFVQTTFQALHDSENCSYIHFSALQKVIEWVNMGYSVTWESQRKNN